MPWNPTKPNLLYLKYIYQEDLALYNPELQHIHVQKYDQDIHMHKTFIMFIECSYACRNPKIRNWFRYETFIYLFEFKVFRHEERERHNFLLCWFFHLTPPRATPRCKTTRLASASSENQLPSSSVQSQQTLFFSNSKILSPSLPGMTSFTSPVPFTIWVFYCDICDCHILPARVNTCSQCVHLTNPCTKPN